MPDSRPTVEASGSAVHLTARARPRCQGCAESRFAAPRSPGTRARAGTISTTTSCSHADRSRDRCDGCDGEVIGRESK